MHRWERQLSERVLKLKPDFDLDGFLESTRLNTPRPPKDPTGRPLSFVKQQEERGAVKRGLRPVGLERSIELADQHVAPVALATELGDLEDYSASIRREPIIKGVAPRYVEKTGHRGGCGSKKLREGDACEVRPSTNQFEWYPGVVSKVNYGTGTKFDWEKTTFEVELEDDGPQFTGLRSWEIREPQIQAERRVRTGLDDAGKRYFHASSNIGKEVRRQVQIDPDTREDAALEAKRARERARNERIRDFEEGVDGADRGARTASFSLPSTRRGRRYAVDASASASRARVVLDGFVHAGASAEALAESSHVLDDAAAPAERVPTTEGDGDAMEEDASDALPDAAPPPPPVAAPETTASSEPAPPTTTESGEDDGDAAMAPAKDWRDIARKFQEVASSKLKKADKALFDLVPLDGEDAKDYVPRVADKYSKSKSCYQSLAVALLGSEQGRALNLQGHKDAVFGALEGVSAADFRDESKFTEALPAPAPAPPRTTEEQAWEPDARNMLDEAKDLPRAELGPVLTRYRFTVTSPSKKFSSENPASPPATWPCVYDIIGKNVGGVRAMYQDVIRSKTQLMDYLEEALQQAHDGTSFRSQSQKKAEDAAAARTGPTAAEKRRAGLAKGRAAWRDLEKASLIHWHDLAEDTLRHNVYRSMSAKRLAMGKEPFLLVGPSGRGPPRGISGFYDGPLAPPDVTTRSQMTEERCTTAEQKAAWRKAKRACEILNGVRDDRGRVVVPGVYEEEYKAWKAMGGDESVVGSREERQDYSERGLYATAIRNAIDALRRDEPLRFYRMARASLRYMIGCSDRHVTALAEHAGVDKEDLVRLDARGDQYFVSGSAPCRLPGVLHGLVRPLHIEHVNGTWVGDSAVLELKVRGLEDAKFNRAEPDYAFVTKTLGVKGFVDVYLDHGALCCSEDDAERELFQVEMEPMSTAARQTFLALPSNKRSQKETDFLKRDVVAGVVKPKTDEDRRRSEILYARHEGLKLVPIASEQAGRGTWTAVSRLPERKKKIGEWYDAKVLRRRDDGTFDVRFNDCGYVAKGVASTDLNMRKCTGDSLSALVGKKGKACYRGTKLDLDHVGLGWRREPVAPSKEYPDGLKWHRILGIRDLLDYDINRNLSGYEWIKNMDLVGYLKSYYANAFYKVGGGGLEAKDWVLWWTPAKGWAYGAFS